LLTEKLGIIVERQTLNSPWQDHRWLPVSVMSATGAGKEWRLLVENEKAKSYHAGDYELELHKSDTEAYKLNLTTKPPRLFIVLRPQSDGEFPQVVLLTANPYEAQSYTVGGDEIVEGVTMPPEIAAWVADFVERFHVDEPFVKRRLRRNDDGTGGGCEREE
jgi:hypothetical protein